MESERGAGFAAGFFGGFGGGAGCGGVPAGGGGGGEASWRGGGGGGCFLGGVWWGWGEGVGGDLLAGEDVDGLAEEGGVFDAVLFAGGAEGGECGGGVIGIDFPAALAGGRDFGELFELLGVAADEEAGLVDVGDGGAA